MFHQGSEMLRGAVTFVFGETVLRELPVVIHHQTIARNLGQHAGSGDGIAEAVALDDGGLGEMERFHRAPIHEHVLRGRAQLVEREVHGQMSGLEDVDGVDLPGFNLAEPEANLRMFRERGEKLFALPFGELLGIIQPAQ